MKLIVIRHAKVLFNWENVYNADEFNQACIGYSEADVFSEISSEIKTGKMPIFISELRRTEDTARLLFRDRDFIKNELFNEVELHSFLEVPFKLPTILWKAMGRTHWLLNIRTQPEIRKETIRRAHQAIDQLESRQQDAILVSHGIFMQVLFRELKNRGYTVKRSGSLWLENLDMIVAKK
ncbi:histidine phosphatase family protein [Eubacteriaceae bacterium ES2]|nr:histidine phosphatase family protein [Eubacteriaceae bacterium ES2]